MLLINPHDLNTLLEFQFQIYYLQEEPFLYPDL